MSGTNSGAGRYLALDDLTGNVRLARRLPRAVAFRYHALPVAQDGDRVTVAMADPDDAAAACAVAAALGTMPYMVQSDRTTIDTLLAKLWPDESPPSLHLLVYAHDSPRADVLSTYAQLLGDLLGAHVSCFDANGDLDALTNEVTRVGHDLVICGESCQSLLHRLLFGPADSRAADMVPTSLLVVRGHRWPLKRVLLAIRPQEAERNEAALDWVVRLARPSGAAVTALTVVPPAPGMYQGGKPMQQGLTALLTTNTPLGREMRRVARRLVDQKIESKLRLRQGPPGWQLRLDVIAGDYDLIVIGADADNRWLRWLMGGQVNPLLRWADRPVLIARPSPREDRCIQSQLSKMTRPREPR